MTYVYDASETSQTGVLTIYSNQRPDLYGAAEVEAELNALAGEVDELKRAAEVQRLLRTRATEFDVVEVARRPEKNEEITYNVRAYGCPALTSAEVLARLQLVECARQRAYYEHAHIMSLRWKELYAKTHTLMEEYRAAASEAGALETRLTEAQHAADVNQDALADALRTIASLETALKEANARAVAHGALDVEKVAEFKADLEVKFDALDSYLSPIRR